ncbi:hypothetical protein DEO72_LG9g1966 [Vigna unguiculata]|uniref:Uncharacterized protein n=1 Tax=Vigna unguiculata TaxID=3917 RepID=A0A4D6N1W8_VIGUN|nr:hypothetical protein DEO72_LG9g1966 [Vigna unguiculata]
MVDRDELMQKKFGLVVNTVNAGKCGSVRNWYEPPGGTWVTARRRIRGESVWNCDVPSATIGRGVHSMVIACVPGSKLCKLGCVTTGDESVGLDYEQDWLIGLDHERDSFVEAQ